MILSYINVLYCEDNIWNFYIWGKIAAIIQSQNIVFKYRKQSVHLTSSYWKTQENVCMYIYICEIIHKNITSGIIHTSMHIIVAEYNGRFNLKQQFSEKKQANTFNFYIIEILWSTFYSGWHFKKFQFMSLHICMGYVLDLSTSKCTTLKRYQFLNHFLFSIEIAQQVYFFA